jgi:hypothetical protein
MTVGAPGTGESRFFVQLDGFDQRRNLPGEHGGLHHQFHRHRQSTAPAACLVIESNAVTSNQQNGTDLLTKTLPPTLSDLIAGIDRVEGMLSDTIKVYERVKRTRRTSSSSSMPRGLRNAAHIASRYMKRKI